MFKSTTAIIVSLVALGLVLATPLIALCGLNFILESGGYSEIQYTIESWFGVLLLLFSAKLKVR